MAVPLRYLPDVKELAIWFLLDQPEVQSFFAADTPHDRVYGQLPRAKVWPLVRVTTFNDIPVVRGHLSITSLQVEAFGGPSKLAHELADTCRAALRDRLPGLQHGAVVTDVRCFGFREQPDESFESARPRWLFAAEIANHPLADSGS